MGAWCYSGGEAKNVVGSGLCTGVNGFKVDVIQFLECPVIFGLLMWQETTLFLQLLYRNEFKDDFLLVLKNKYEDMIISAVHDKDYLENYKHLDTNLDRGMHIFHLLYDMR